MATNFEQVAKGTHFLFDKAGEGIAMHSHLDRDTRHSTRCLAGSCHIYGDGVNEVLTIGQNLQFKSYRAHELVALEDRTEIINEFEYGPPEGWAIGEKGSVVPILMGDIEFEEQEQW